jgi:hypothetical protein
MFSISFIFRPGTYDDEFRLGTAQTPERPRGRSRCPGPV